MNRVAPKPKRGTSRQIELKALHKLSDREFAAMLDNLTSAELAALENSDFIAEDEADMIVINRR